MKTGKIGRILAVCIGASLLTGCGGEKQNTYRQAEENLEQGSYQEALTGYETSVCLLYTSINMLRKICWKTITVLEESSPDILYSASIQPPETESLLL